MSRTEILCYLLWSPLGVRLARVPEDALPTDVLEQTRARLVAGEPVPDAAAAFADSVIDMGPGHRTAYRHFTLRAPTGGARVTFIRGVHFA